ncbi:GYD domain-containing protein [Mesorhizobium silamurunense]|uniref:GYD domain-containing protein n=1 Tax=Mesorhizobium silamurunense TaxID=499528 RepID=UPI001FEB7214|nr:GYD domain-containing protein [Mesorhizobium silamurunense]
MAHYVLLSNFTDQGIRTIKDTQKRAEAFKAMASKSGVKVHTLLWTLGKHDVVVIAEAEDDIAATALALSIAGLTAALLTCAGNRSRRRAWLLGAQVVQLCLVPPDHPPLPVDLHQAPDPDRVRLLSCLRGIAGRSTTFGSPQRPTVSQQNQSDARRFAILGLANRTRIWVTGAKPVAAAAL